MRNTIVRTLITLLIAVAVPMVAAETAHASTHASVVAAKKKPKKHKVHRVPVTPMPVAEPAPVPLPVLPMAGDGYAYQNADGQGRPARWDPCTPVTWYFNPAGAPGGTLDATAASFAALAAATGMTFTYGGSSDVVPYVTAELPDAPNVIYIGFATAAVSPLLAGTVTGVGGQRLTGADRGQARIATGLVLLDSEANLPAAMGAGRTWYGVIAHELGHVMNLAHVEAPGAQMAPILASNPGAFSPAESAALAGLAGLGCMN